MSKFIWNFTAMFCGLFILTFDFHYSIIPNFHSFVIPFFEQIVGVSGKYIFGYETGFDKTISSDSVGLFIHVFNLFILSFSLPLGSRRACLNLKSKT